MKQSVTLIRLIKDGLNSGLTTGTNIIDKVGDRFQKVIEDTKNLKHITKEDVKVSAHKVGRASKKALWFGTVATSATAGIASGFILNRIGYEVRSNLMVISEQIVDGKTIREFVKAPTNKMGIVIDREDRNLQILGIITEIGGGLIMVAVAATTLNVELYTKEDQPTEEYVND